MDTGTGGVDGGNKKAFNLHSRPSGHVGNLLQNIFVAFAGFHVIFLGFERHQNGKGPNITTG